VVCRPGEAHQIINDSNKDLVIQITADNPISDIIEYPDSGKCAIHPKSEGLLNAASQLLRRGGVIQNHSELVLAVLQH